ncbi:MAG: tetratricopeptide repeat protein [Bacteroidales bacterium]|nr:tetratricopeptide repeat protein [Bacteroidales bacterium]
MPKSLNSPVALFISALILVVSISSCNMSTESTPESKAPEGDSTTMELNRLTDAIVKNPDKSGPYLSRARYYLRKDQFNEALQDVNKAITVDEKNAEVYITLSDVYLYSGKTQRALDALKKAGTLEPKLARIDVKTAKLYLTMSDYKQTFNFLRSALKKDPDNAEAFFISGLANEEMGDTTKAIESYQMAVLRDQSYYDALKQLGILFSIRKDKLAIDYLRNAAQLRPEQPEPLYILGMHYQDNGEADKSLSVYNEILQIDSGFKLAWYNKGYVQMVYKHDYRMATESFSRAISLDAGYVEAWYNRGYAFELLGDKKNAKKNYDEVLRISVNNDKAIQGLNRLDAMN